MSRRIGGRPDRRPFAIYLTDAGGMCVLLTDGAYTSVSNVRTTEQPQWFKPRLFKLKRDAAAWAQERCNSRTDSRISVDRYTQV